MNSIKKRWQLMMHDIGVDLLKEYKDNFRRKAFFEKKWKDRKYKGKGTLMNVSERLRNTLSFEESMNRIEFVNATPYASIHNEGGIIEQEPSDLQRKFYWAKYKETKNPMYKASALAKKVRIPIPQRQFVGYHKTVDKIVEEHAQDMIEDVINEHLKQFKK